MYGAVLPDLISTVVAERGLKFQAADAHTAGSDPGRQRAALSQTRQPCSPRRQLWKEPLSSLTENNDPRKETVLWFIPVTSSS